MDWNGMERHGMARKLPVLDFDGRLARKLRFHISSFQILRDNSHESFVFTSCTFTFFREVSHGSFVFISCAFTFEGGLARNAFLRDSGCTKCCVLQDRTCPGRWMRKLVRRAVAEHSRLNRGHFRISSAMELTVQALFSQFDLTKFEGGLAGKLCFHIFHCHFLREVSNEKFVFASSILSV